jgi:hypothetical protein
MSNVGNAMALVSREMQDLALLIEEDERENFFDPRNRDMWMDWFINRLTARYQQRDRIASND